MAETDCGNIVGEFYKRQANQLYVHTDYSKFDGITDLYTPMQQKEALKLLRQRVGPDPDAAESARVKLAGEHLEFMRYICMKYQILWVTAEQEPEFDMAAWGQSRASNGKQKGVCDGTGL